MKYALGETRLNIILMTLKNVEQHTRKFQLTFILKSLTQDFRSLTLFQGPYKHQITDLVPLDLDDTNSNLRNQRTENEKIIAILLIFVISHMNTLN